MQQCLGRSLQVPVPARPSALRPCMPVRAPAAATRPCPQRLRGVCSAAAAEVRPASDIEGMEAFLDSLKWDANGLVVAIAQDADTGEVLMQAFADRAAVLETLQTGLATFYSRSRKGRWCKGETSGHFIKVLSMYMDCDRDSLIFLSSPIGPACHTNAPTCYFTQMEVSGGRLLKAGSHDSGAHMPRITLFELESTIQQRREAMEAGTEGKPSWTSKLLSNPELLCKKVREEAGELCQTLEESEGKERAASEMADLLYHAMVLMNVQGVSMKEVMEVLRGRFGTSGIEEKAARPPKAQQ